MNEFEKARQEIEEIKKVAEANRLAEAQRKLAEEEEGRRKQLEAQDKEKAREKTLEIIKQQGPELLKVINTELFNGRAVVTPWKDNLREWSRESWDDYSHTKTWFRDVFKETSLKIPGIGEIAIGIPLSMSEKTEDIDSFGVNRSSSGWKKFVPQSKSVCLLGVVEEKGEPNQQLIDLDTPHDQLPEVLKRHILDSVVALHKKALGL